MYKEMLEQMKIEQTTDFTLSILTYEVGKLHQMKIYAERFGQDRALFLGDRRVEMADTIVMAKLLAEQYGYDPEELEDEGLERFRTRLGEIKTAELERKYGDQQ